MKKILSILPLTIILCGCGGNDPIGARNSVLEAFPNSEITVIPGRVYHFIVRDTNGAIWAVECVNMHDVKISSMAQLFPAKQ